MRMQGERKNGKTEEIKGWKEWDLWDEEKKDV